MLQRIRLQEGKCQHAPWRPKQLRLAYGFFWCAREAFFKATSIEEVAPITERNAHLLPTEETLLRGSSPPPTVQQAELLRAIQAGQETAKEELLRATTGEE